MALAEIGLLAAAAGLIAAVVDHRADSTDLRLTGWLQRTGGPVVSAVLAVASWPGYPPQSRILPPLAIGGSWLLGNRIDAMFQLGAWGTGALSTALKWSVRRPRPIAPQVLVVRARLLGTSFPSGHVLTFVGFYGFLAYLLARRVDRFALRAAGVTSLVALIALVGPSRVQQGHHWTSDVAGSYLVGLAYLLALIELHRQVEARVGGLRPAASAGSG